MHHPDPLQEDMASAAVVPAVPAAGVVAAAASAAAGQIAKAGPSQLRTTGCPSFAELVCFGCCSHVQPLTSSVAPHNLLITWAAQS